MFKSDIDRTSALITGVVSHGKGMNEVFSFQNTSDEYLGFTQEGRLTTTKEMTDFNKWFFLNTEQDPNHSHSGDNGKGVIDKPPIFQEEGECLQQCGDQSTYMQRFTINEMPVGTKDGRATFLIGDLQGNETDKKRVTAFQKNKEDFIMREVVHNWHFEVDGKNTSQNRNVITIWEMEQ